MTEELLKYTKALVALQAITYEMGEMPVKIELLLARAGLSHREIAELLGKKYGAVAQTLSRAGRSRTRSTAHD